MKYPLRVLHIVVNMNRGGAETLIMNIYRNIDRTKVQFDFLVHRELKGAYEDEITALGGNIYRIPYVTDVGHNGYKRALSKFFSQHTEYRIVHTHMNSMSGMVLEVSKNAGIPIRISHSHNTRNEGNIIIRLYKWYIGMKIIPNATHLFACSSVAGKWLFKKKSCNMQIMSNGVEVEKFLFSVSTRKKKRDELMIGDNTLVLGHVGRFCHQKNHKYLIDIFSEVNKEHPNSVLLLVGDGPLGSVIRKKVQQLKLEHSVVFLGVRSDVADWMNAMDVLLFPSYHEGLPVTIIEAQASGLKCVVSKAVSEDADIGAGLITRINLNDDTHVWVDEVVKPYNRRVDTKSYLDRAGYNIAYTTGKLQNLYLSTLLLNKICS